MRRLLIGLACFLASCPLLAQAPSKTASVLRFDNGSWAIYQAAPDSIASAWCAAYWRFAGDTVYVGPMEQTTQFIDPPCGRTAIVLKRPSCAFHFLETVHWWIEPPRALIATCKDDQGPHFIAAEWPVVGSQHALRIAP